MPSIQLRDRCESPISVVVYKECPKCPNTYSVELVMNQSGFIDPELFLREVSE